HRFAKTVPAGTLLGQLAAAGGGQAVHPDPLFVLGNLPVRGHGAFALETVERGVEGARIDLEGVARARSDRAGDPVAVLRPPGQCLQDEEVEGSLEKLDRVLVRLAVRHVDSLHPMDVGCLHPQAVRFREAPSSGGKGTGWSGARRALRRWDRT